jgi:hypothetical protein
LRESIYHSSLLVAGGWNHTMSASPPDTEANEGRQWKASAEGVLRNAAMYLRCSDASKRGGRPLPSKGARRADTGSALAARFHCSAPQLMGGRRAVQFLRARGAEQTQSAQRGATSLRPSLPALESSQKKEPSGTWPRLGGSPRGSVPTAEGCENLAVQPGCPSPNSRGTPSSV